MKRRDIIAISLCAALLCAGILGAAFSNPSREAVVAPPVDPPVVAPETKQPISMVQATQPIPVAEAPKPIATPTPHAMLAELSTHGTGGDGKEILPSDGKESLLPVSELLLGRAGPNGMPGGPTTEFLNKKDPLLDPPSSQNVAGPVVSQETK